MKQPDFISIRQATSEDRINIVGLQCRALSVLATKDYSLRQIKALLRSKSKPRLACETRACHQLEKRAFFGLFTTYCVEK